MYKGLVCICVYAFQCLDVCWYLSVSVSVSRYICVSISLYMCLCLSLSISVSFMSVGDTHVLHFLGRSQFYIILTFSEKGEFICVSVNCKAVIKYPIRTCKLGRNSIIIRPHILKIGSADSSDT